MPRVDADGIQKALRQFAKALTSNFALAASNPAQPEDQLKGPTVQLFRDAGAVLGYEVIARTEARTELGARPDLGVTAKGLLIGHVELKAPSKGVQPRDFSAKHDREQFKKLADHPNLIYTDGNDWALYRLGKIVEPLVRAQGDVRTDGADAFDEGNASDFTTLLLNFLTWEPLVPTSPKALAEMLAPLTRLLRENVATALTDKGSALTRLAEEWRDYFFPEADDAHFADAYAQTLTYALLLARVEGEQDLHARAAERLDERHGLLAQVLRVLEQPAAREEVEVPVDLLERAIQAVDRDALAKRAKGRDPWLYFYEDFLAAYDSKLRKQTGVYFTPPSVVRAQVALTDELLRERFGIELGFAGEDVTVLDPAVGTGTYLLAAIQKGLDRVQAEYGPGAEAQRATSMAANLHGFELLIGAYAVATLRLSQAVLDSGGTLPGDGAHIYLTDTLESPLAPYEREHPPLFQEKLAKENERARHVKADVPVLVCIGNPPYFRQVIEPGEEGVERLGGWVRRGDEGQEAIFGDFLRDAPGVHVKNLYNLYVYFWRWALWKVVRERTEPRRRDFHHRVVLSPRARFRRHAAIHARGPGRALDSGPRRRGPRGAAERERLRHPDSRRDCRCSTRGRARSEHSGPRPLCTHRRDEGGEVRVARSDRELRRCAMAGVLLGLDRALPSAERGQLLLVAVADRSLPVAALRSSVQAHVAYRPRSRDTDPSLGRPCQCRRRRASGAISSG